MKAEHRRELQTNALADSVGRFIQGIKSPGQSTNTLLWTFVLLAVVAYGVWQYLAAGARTNASALWLAVNTATHENPGKMDERLSELSKTNAGTFAARTASFELARKSLASGADASNPPLRSEALQALRQARDLYEKLSTQCTDSAILAQEALMGVAKAQEALAGSEKPEDAKKDLETAIASYLKLSKAYPQSLLGITAKDRAEDLQAKIDEVAKFYQSLAENTRFRVQSDPQLGP